MQFPSYRRLPSRLSNLILKGKTVALFLIGMVLTAVVLGLLVAVVIPFFSAQGCLLNWNPPSTTDGEFARTYYAVYGALGSVLTSFIGLLLGYFYFRGRTTFDQTIHETSRKRAYARLLLESLNDYDEVVGTLIVTGIASAPEAQEKRNLIRRKWSNVLLLLENAPGQEIISPDERTAILELDSFVEKLSFFRWGSLNVGSLSVLVNETEPYYDLYKRARNICVKYAI